MLMQKDFDIIIEILDLEPVVSQRLSKRKAEIPQIQS